MPILSKVKVKTLLALLILLACFAAACSAKTTTTGTGASASASPTSASSAQCATAGTRHFEKTRLVADLGLAYGAFHRYLYKPYQAGTFAKGAPGRTTAIIKGGLAAAVIAKLAKNAAANAAADPTLCKYVPSMSAITSQISGLGSQLAGGAAAAGSLTQAEGLFAKLKSVVGFTDKPTSTLPGLG